MLSHFETLKSLLVLSLLFAAPVFTQAQSTASKCIALADVQELQKDVKFLESYDAADLCRPESRPYRLAETLLYMKNFRWDVEKNKSNPFNQDIMPSSFWEFFVSGLKKTIVDGGDAPGNSDASAATIPALQDGNIYLFEAFIEETPLLCESQIFCTKHSISTKVLMSFSERAGAVKKKGCDQNIKEKRSWAVTLEALTKMLLPAQGSIRLSDDERLKTKQELMQMSAFVFNESMNLHGVYLMDENDQAYIYDGTTLAPVRTVKNAKIFSRYLTLLSFPWIRSANATVNVFSSQLDLLPPSGGTAVTLQQPTQARP